MLLRDLHESLHLPGEYWLLSLLVILTACRKDAMIYGLQVHQKVPQLRLWVPFVLQRVCFIRKKMRPIDVCMSTAVSIYSLMSQLIQQSDSL